MPLKTRPSLPTLALIGAVALSGGTGCSRASRLDAAIAQAGASKERVFPMAGKVTVDGLPPELKSRETLIVMLCDPHKLDRPPGENPYAAANPKTGAFAFTTYAARDGVKAGKYVVTFAVLTSKGKAGLLGPDKLNNLYNDPDKNSGIAGFTIEHKSPGESDYSFNLEVAGIDPAEPGPHAVTAIR